MSVEDLQRQKAPTAAPWPARYAESALPSVSALVRWLASNWDIVFIAATLSATVLYLGYTIVSGRIFWDFAVYDAGIATYRAIGSPYHPDYLSRVYGVDMPFSYSVIALHFLDGIWNFVRHPVGLGIVALLHAAAWLAVPYLLMPAPRRLLTRESALLLTLFLVAFGFGGAKLLASGNFGAMLSALCLGALVLSIRERNYMWLWAALLFACQFKIYFILFAAVPYLFGRRMIEAPIASALILGSSALNGIIAPSLTAEFTNNLGAMSQAAGHVGVSVMGAVIVALKEIGFAPEGLTLIGLGLHGIFCLGVLAVAVAVLWTSARPSDDYTALSFALIAALLLSPRLLDYDLALATIPAFMLLRGILAAGSFGVGILAMGLVLGTALMRTPLADWAALLALLAVYIGAAADFLTGVAPQRIARARP